MILLCVWHAESPHYYLPWSRLMLTWMGLEIPCRRAQSLGKFNPTSSQQSVSVVIDISNRSSRQRKGENVWRDGKGEERKEGNVFLWKRQSAVQQMLNDL